MRVALPNLSTLPQVMRHGQLGIGLAAAMADGSDSLESWITLIVVYRGRPPVLTEVRGVELAATSFRLHVCTVRRLLLPVLSIQRTQSAREAADAMHLKQLSHATQGINLSTVSVDTKLWEVASAVGKFATLTELNALPLIPLWPSLLWCHQ